MQQSIKWEIEANCNLQCKHCFLGETSYRNTLSLNDYKKILFKLKLNNVQAITFTAKEPFLNKYIINILELCKNYKIKTAIISNGTLITHEIVEELYKTNLSRLNLSLEGWEATDNDYIRGAGVYSKVVDVINIISSENRYRTNKIILGLQINLTSINIKKIESLLRFIQEYPNVILTFSLISPLGNAKHCLDLLIDYNDFNDFRYKLLKNLCKNETFVSDRIHFGFSSYYSIIFFNILGLTFQFPELPNCSVLDNNFTILPNGDICRCSQLFEDANLNIDNNIGNIFDKIEITKINQDAMNNNYKKSGICKKCSYVDKCNFCLASQNKNVFDFYKKDCEHYLNLLEIILRKVLLSQIRITLNDHVAIIKHNSIICIYIFYSYKTVKVEISKEIYVFLLSMKNKYVKINFSYNEKFLNEFRELFMKSVFKIQEDEIDGILSNYR